MNGDEARRAERERALAGDPKAQRRFRKLSEAMTVVGGMSPPSMNWSTFSNLVGASRKDLNSWKTYLSMAKKWSVFPVPPHSFDSLGITVLTLPVSTPPLAAAGVESNVSFRVADVLPIVYRIITDRTWKDSAFLSHEQITSALLQDPEGAALVQEAVSRNGLPSSSVASNMVAWFSQHYTTGKTEFEKQLDRKKVGVTWAYRSLQATSTGVAADEDAVFAVEGAPLLVSHLKRERSSKLRNQKLFAVQATGGKLACEACGFETLLRFPQIACEVLEVHHRIPLSAATGSVEISLEDLALLCPTCHRAIHRTGMSVEEFVAKYFH